MKRSVQQAMAARARGHRAVRAVTVGVATLAASTSAGLAWAASATTTGRSHHPKTTTGTASRPVPHTARRPRRKHDDLPPPAGPVIPPASSVPETLTAPPSAAPAHDPYAYAPAPDPYVPPVASSGGS